MKITIATYNAKNFFDDLDPHTQKKSSEVDALGQMVDRIGADIIAFQEVESERSLEWLNSKLSKPYDYYALIDGNSDRDINLGFMSRYNFYTTTHRDVKLKNSSGKIIRDYRTKKDFRAKRKSAMGFQRDLLLGEFMLGGGRSISVFNTHFKSRSRKKWQLTSSDNLRSAESRAAKKIVSEYVATYPETPVVLLGDFNNTSRNKTIRSVMSQLGFKDALKAEVGSNATTYWRKAKDRIDYIMLSNVAAAGYIPNSGKIHASKTARTASDHFPVSVTLDL